MTQTTYTSIEIIFDRDHGTDNHGWFSRTRDTDGQEQDENIETAWALDPNVAESTITNWAMEYYADPDGMNDARLQDLSKAITVRR